MGMWKIELEEQESEASWFVARPNLALAIAATVWQFQNDVNQMGDLIIGIGEAINDMLHQGGQSGTAEIGDMDMARATIKVFYSEGES